MATKVLDGIIMQEKLASMRGLELILAKFTSIAMIPTLALAERWLWLGW